MKSELKLVHNPENFFIKRIPDYINRDGFIKKSFYFKYECTEIGSRGKAGKDNRFHIPSCRISRLQSIFTFADDGKLSISNHSNMGTWLNGVKIADGQKIELKENDLIGLGSDTTEECMQDNDKWIFKVCKDPMECVDLISEDEGIEKEMVCEQIPVEESFGGNENEDEKAIFQHNSDEEDNMFEDPDDDEDDDNDSGQFYIDQDDNDQPSTSSAFANFYNQIPETSKNEPKTPKTNLIDTATAKHKFETAKKMRHLGKEAPKIIEAHEMPRRRRGRKPAADMSKKIKENLTKNYTKKTPASRIEKLKKISNDQSPPEKRSKPIKNAPVKCKITELNRNEQFAKDIVSSSTAAMNK